MTTRFILSDDIDINTALNMLEIFKTSVNNLIILDNVIMPDGKVLVKGGAIHDLLVNIINCQKQLRLDKAFNKTNQVIHTHIWDNETPNRLYQHKHTIGEIPHGHHGSKYWKPTIDKDEGEQHDWHDEDEKRCQNMKE